MQGPAAASCNQCATKGRQPFNSKLPHDCTKALGPARLQVAVLGQSSVQQPTCAGLEGYPPEALAQMLLALAPEARCMVLSTMPEAQRWQVRRLAGWLAIAPGLPALLS
jgi:hypothetical protein